MVKAPEREIDSLRGSSPVQFRHELYTHPAAPVIRLVLTFFDQPASRFALETFINVEDPQQHADYAQLARQREVFLLFYDEALRHRLSKQVPAPAPANVLRTLQEAERRFLAIPRHQFDFDQAKAAVLKEVTL